MSREERITCDQCGAVKKETNHWYYADVSTGGLFLLGPFETEFRFKDASNGAQDICGHQCAIAALNQFLQTGKLNTEKKPHENN